MSTTSEAPAKFGSLPVTRTDSRLLPAAERLAKPLHGGVGKSWSLKSLKDTRENVIEAIQGTVTLPDEAKALLVAAINEAHPRSRLICVDAHCQVVAGPDGRVKHHGCWDISEV